MVFNQNQKKRQIYELEEVFWLSQSFQVTMGLRNRGSKIQLFLLATITNLILYTFSKRQEMGERRPWTPQQDDVLQKLYQIQGITRWSQISRLMETDYHIMGRNGKQCRQRYHNYLKGGIKRDRWTPQEEELLVELHAQHGNRWSYISKLIQGRSQNCVKNMLYSKMRKTVRQLNRFSYIYYRKSLKQIKLTFVNRLIDITETAYKKAEKDRSPAESAAIDIKNQILMMNIDEKEQMLEEEKDQMKELVQKIYHYKKDNQSYHRSVILTKVKKLKLKKKNKQDDLSDEQIDESEEQQSQKEENSERIHWRTRETVHRSINQKIEQILNLCDKTRNKINNPSSVNVHKISVQSQKSSLKEQLKSKIELSRANSITNTFLNSYSEEGLELPIQIGDMPLNTTPQRSDILYNFWGEKDL